MTTAWILMPFYNSEKYISKTLDSIFSQDYPHIIVLLYNDGSTDASLSIIKQYQTKYKDKIVVLNNCKNKGIAVARNELLEYVKDSKNNVNDMDYIFQLDSDDCYSYNQVISSSILQMQKTNATVLLLDFDFIFEDKEVIITAGILKEKIDSKSIANHYYSKDNISFIPQEGILGFTTLGWTKVYRADLYKTLISVKEDGKFEDFVAMCLLISPLAKITSLGEDCPSSILFTKHLNSTTSSRKAKDFDDVIDRLLEFKMVVESEEYNESRIKYKDDIKNLLEKKYYQYEEILSKNINVNDINEETLKHYQSRKNELLCI